MLVDQPDSRHLVHFYGTDERHHVSSVQSYFATGLAGGALGLAVARPEILQALATFGPDLIRLEAQATLDAFLTGGEPSWELFDATVGAHVRLLSEAGRPIRAYGEMVGLLWTLGNRSAALRLEQFWNRLQRAYPVTLYCGYPLDIFETGFDIGAVDGIMCAHTRVVSSGSDGHVRRALDLAIDEVLGAQAASLRPLIKPNFRPTWARIPREEATTLWLRNNLPGAADEIMHRARELYAKRFAA
ncbi:MAG: MEDS domain-containing protein [Candidatus Eremiobacteraeota bacterium]|nr:MEDS domain-containing protein [Candidatus Eremiobacteraeota bacterium]